MLIQASLPVQAWLNTQSPSIYFYIRLNLHIVYDIYINIFSSLAGLIEPADSCDIIYPTWTAQQNQHPVYCSTDPSYNINQKWLQKGFRGQVRANKPNWFRT